jgi:outer membrane protein assembly factor BamB
MVINQKLIFNSIIVLLFIGAIFTYSMFFNKNEKILLEPRFWPMLYGNNQHYYDLSLNKTPDEIDYLLMPKSFIKNIFPFLFIQDTEIFNAVSDDEYIYIQNSYKINKYNKKRKLIWSYESNSDILPFTRGSMVLVDNHIITLRYSSRQKNGLIIAIDKITCEVSWFFELENWPYVPDRPNSVVLTVNNGNVFVGIDSYKGKNNFYAFDSLNGKVLWEQTIPGNFLVDSTPAIYSDKIYVVTQVNEGFSKIYVLDSANGRILNAIPLKGDFKNPGIIIGNSMFIVSDVIQDPKPHSITYNIDLNNNKIKWQLQGETTFTYTIKGNLMILGGLNKISALDINSKAIKWAIEEKEGNGYEFFVYEKRLIATSSDGYIYFINLDDGKILRKNRIQTNWQKKLDYTPDILYSIPAENGVISFLDTGDIAYVH